MSSAATGSFEVPVDVESRADLHLHSTCSDGRLEPAAVISAAEELGLKAVSLTDHDSVAGVHAAREAAEALGLPFVPGIEYSAYDDTGSTHLLGYFIDPDHGELVAYLKGAQESRVRRAAEIVDKLNRLGVEVTLDEVKTQVSETGLIARPHVAQALVKGRWVRSYGEAFDRFIAAGQPAYVPTQRISPAEGIKLIHAAGGLAVLAHGGRTHSDEAIRQLVDEGLDGLETLHPDHGPFEVRRLRRLAAELDLLETGGSDWHGFSEARRGQPGSQPVPYEWYERLRDAALPGRGAGFNRGR